jgi:hypothetical protein
MTSLIARIVLMVALALVPACTIEFVDHPDRGDRTPDAGYWPIDDAAWWPLDDAAWTPADAAWPTADAYLPPPDGGAGPTDDAAVRAICGDGIVDVEQGEECDAGSDGSTPFCDADCTLPACGDGFLNRAAGEACEPGMVGCTSACQYGAPMQLVPTVTGPGGAGARAQCSSIYDELYPCWHAFDASSSSQWISQEFLGPAWLGYSWLDGAPTVSRYAILFANGSLTSRAPLDFTLEGFDGASWVVIDRRAGQRDWLGYERREYEVAEPRAFTAYRLHISDDNDDRKGLVVASIARLELLGFR